MSVKKISLVFFLLLFLFIVLNYGRMLYTSFTGNGGDWVEFYHYETSSDKLIHEVVTFKQNNPKLWLPNDTSILTDQKQYVYIRFFNESKYYHVWISTDISSQNKSFLIFGGVSSTADYSKARRINKDMGLIERIMTLKKFKMLVLDRLNVRPIDL